MNDATIWRLFMAVVCWIWAPIVGIGGAVINSHEPGWKPIALVVAAAIITAFAGFYTCLVAIAIIGKDTPNGRL